MAEVLGIVSGAAGLVSITLQIAEEAQKLRKLASSLKNAPESLSRIANEMETLGLLLRLVERDYELVDDFQSDLLGRCLGLCRKGVTDIQATARKLAATLGKHKVWGRVMYVFEEEEVGRLCDDLERAKGLLFQATAVASESLRRKDSARGWQMLNEVKAQLDEHTALLTAHRDALQHIGHGGDAPHPHSLPDRSHAGAHLGWREVSRRKPGRQRWNYQVRPMPWVISKIWDVSICKEYAGWNVLLRTRNLVPEDAPILNACFRGDYVEARKLITEGKASPYDTAGGWETPILTALDSGNFELTDYLFRLVGWSGDIVDLMLASRDDLGSSALHRERWFRTFFESAEADLEFLTTMSRPTWIQSWIWMHHGDSNTLRVLQGSLDRPYGSLPLDIRFHQAMTLGLVFPPDIFRQLLGVEFSDPCLARLRSTEDYCDIAEGSTMLHVFASKMPTREDRRLWEAPMRQTLQAGVDPHSRNSAGETALDLLISMCELYQLHDSFQTFMRALSDSGIDPAEFVARFNSRIDQGFEAGLSRVQRIAHIVVGEGARDIDLDIRLKDYIVVRHPTSLPGEWPREQTDVALPEIRLRADAGRGDWSKSMSTRPMRASQVAELWGLHSLSSIRSSAQDDSGRFARSMTRSSRRMDRRRPSPRACSSPPDFLSSCHVAQISTSNDLEWRTYLSRLVHYCRRTGSWKSFDDDYVFDGEDGEARCMKGECAQTDDFWIHILNILRDDWLLMKKGTRPED